MALIKYDGPPSPEFISVFENDEMDNLNNSDRIWQQALDIVNSSEPPDTAYNDHVSLSYLRSGNLEEDSVIDDLEHALNGTGPMSCNYPSNQTASTPVVPSRESLPSATPPRPENDNSEVQPIIGNHEEEQATPSRDQPSVNQDSEKTPAFSPISLKRKRDDDSFTNVKGISITADTAGETSIPNLPSAQYTPFDDNTNSSQDHQQGLEQGNCLDQDVIERGPKRLRKEGSPKPSFKGEKSD
ncbi:uncharacterized protein [Palaemon carinicauda]|uniref:uncharacterized protein isoform X2 n=1 Tax=Palaemon carinicauda TaxID=392227 RepID=UPI0035B5EA9A